MKALLRVLVLAAAVLAAVPAASAGRSGACSVTMSGSRGAAPYHVTFHAKCASGAYRWSFGDGSTASGRTVRHTFVRGGRFAPRLTTGAGVTRLPAVTSVALTVTAPGHADYGTTVTVRATVKPPMPVRLGGKLFQGGALPVKVTQPFLSVSAGPATVRTAIVVKPVLDVQLDGARTIGSPLEVVAKLLPASAGSVQVKVDGQLSTVVPTDSLHTARIVVSTTPRPSWAGAWRVVDAHIHAPSLAYGARGSAVVALEQRLGELHYALRDTDGVFDDDDQGAVLAFQKVNGLERTGVVTPQLWSLLAHAGVPRARYGGDHVEVDKTRQVLFLVRDGQVVLTTHASTGATGNTPLGEWHVYAKRTGWDWVLWYPSYFLRGFAIHGYPEVPAYPASHGCVRIPMWLAPSLFEQIPMGSTVYVYA